MVLSAKRERAEYFRERRKTIGKFSVDVPKDKLSAFDEKLKETNETRTSWLNRKIDEELGK